MNNEKILILEDEKIIAIDLQRKLERFGYAVVGMAERAEDAIAMARDLSPDMLLSDIMLQGDVDGIAELEAPKVSPVGAKERRNFWHELPESRGRRPHADIGKPHIPTQRVAI